MTAIERAKVIRFNDDTLISYEPPRDTLDPRYAACTDHHPACDCREAHHAEDFTEFRSERDQTQRAFDTVLRGHQTWAYDAEDQRDEYAECKCTGCQIARLTNHRPSYRMCIERHEDRRR